MSESSVGNPSTDQNVEERPVQFQPEPALVLLMAGSLSLVIFLILLSYLSLTAFTPGLPDDVVQSKALNAIVLTCAFVTILLVAWACDQPTRIRNANKETAWLLYQQNATLLAYAENARRQNNDILKRLPQV